MEISEQSLYWRVFEDTESKMLRLMFKFERRNLQEFRENDMRKALLLTSFQIDLR